MRGGRDGGRVGSHLRIGLVLAIAALVAVGNVETSYGSNEVAAPRRSTSSSTAVGASPYLVLTAASLDAIGLTYVGTFTVSGQSGTVQVLRFTLTRGALAAMRFVQACSANVTTLTTAPTASLGSTVIDAAKLLVTIDGTPMTFTVASPPTTQFPAHVLLQQLRLTAITLSATRLSTSLATTTALAC
jgi:hypothetical protein